MSYRRKNDSFNLKLSRRRDVLAVRAADFTVYNEGTIVLLQPLTSAANVWVDEHIPTGALLWGTAVVVEHRYIEDILIGVVNDGLTVRVGQ